MNCTNELPCPPAAGWVQPVRIPGRRLEGGDRGLLVSSLRSCFRVVCVSQPKVSGSWYGLLITYSSK